jgi:hypothetical protein
MTVRVYLLAMIAITVVEGLFLTVWQLATGDFNVAAGAVLAAKLAIDLAFVASNRAAFRVGRIEALFLAWIAIAIVRGAAAVVGGESEFEASRIIKDCLPPVLFLLKIAVFRAYFARTELNYVQLAMALLVASALNVAAFYAVGGASDFYVGLTPPVTAGVAAAIATSSTGVFAVSLAIIYLTGKRSFLVAVAALLAWLVTLGRATRSMLAPRFLPGLVLVAVAGVVAAFASGSPVTQKIGDTSEAIAESGGVEMLAAFGIASVIDDPEIERALFLATAGRSAEFFVIVREMATSDWWFGKGAGFTYTLTLLDGTEVPNYANAHFSPLSLTYKFGVPFALIFYGWVAWLCVRSQPVSRHVVFHRAVVLLFLVQSFFAFNLFVEFLLPVALGALSAGLQRARVLSSSTLLAPAAGADGRPVRA